MQSIRSRLLVSLLFAAFLTATVIGAVTYRNTIAENEALFDYQLRQIALSLRDQGVVSVPDTGIGSEETPDLIVQIWTADGALMYLSRPGVPLLERAVPGFTDVAANNQRWRVFSLTARGRIIQVAQPMELRRDLVATATLRSLLPLLAFVPLMAFLIWWLVRTSTAPLKRLADEVAKQDMRTLNQLPVTDVPSEVLPLVTALNALLDRLKTSFAGQRAFVADAAHELRSPLTAVDLQSQLLARAPDEAARQSAFEQLRQGIARAARLIEQLLMAARTDPADTVPNLKPVELTELVRQVIADLFPFAQERAVQLEFTAADTAIISADPAMLHILVRNLLDNAIRYAGPGSQVNVSVTTEQSHADIVIEDSGRGIPESEHARVFDRFYRWQTDDQLGSGLGLSIVKNIVEQHAAQIQLGKSSLGGLKVTTTFNC